MLDPKHVRENAELVRQALQNRGYPESFLDDFLVKDQAWRKQLLEVENLKADLKKETPKGKPTDEQLQALKLKSEQVRLKNEGLAALEDEARLAALLLPNVPADDVPMGASEEQNIEVRRVGNPETPAMLPHDEVGQKLGLLDFEKAGKISGARFVVNTGWGAKLERALINFMLDTHTKDHGYQETLPPVLVNSASMTGTGQLPKFESESFRVSDTDFWLSPTAEVQLTNMYRDSILSEDQLPIKLTAYTPCFRKEAGSYGKDVKGIIRLHQFNKVELVQFVKPETSFEALEGLLNNAERILRLLKLPYRVVSLCTGDLGFTSAKTYDIEVWFPSQNRYREISSCSNFRDFQSRRAMIRYKDKSQNKVHYVHTLNGSGLAVGRTLAAILENYQQKDGSVSVPEVLQPYIGESQLPCKSETKIS